MDEIQSESTRKPAHGYGRVRLRKRGKVWHARYPLDDGTRISESLGLTDKDLALDEAKRINAALERGEMPTREEHKEAKGRTFAALADAFLRDYPGWSDGTRASMGGMIRRMVGKFGDRPLESFTTRQVVRYLSDRVREDDLNAKASYNRYRSILSSMFKWGAQQGWVSKNPVEGVAMAKEDEKEPKPYSDEELARLLNALPSEARRVAVLAASTGARKGELCSLLWRHVRFDENLIRIESTKAHVDRSIPLTPDARATLEQVRGDLLKARFGSSVVSLQQSASLDEDPVFGKQADILKAIKSVAEDAGITKASQHRLRDTFGTRCFDVGLPAQEVQRLLGHKTIQMTLRYSRVREHRLHEAIARLAPLPAA